MFSDISSGLLIGLPVMITLGPISLLLLNQGMERGAREALPGALGVATADMTYSSLAALTGAALVAILNPIAPVLRIFGVAVLVWMAWNMARSSRRDVAALRRSSAEKPTTASADMTAESVEPGGPELISGSRQTAVKLKPRRRVAGGDSSTGQGPFAHLMGPRLAVAFFGLTLMNPMTIVLMSAVVIAGGPGIGTVGWAIGMTLASLTAHGGYVLIGSVLRRTCSEMTLARMGTVSSVILVLLSAHLALT